jgi:hypothetical protein
MRRARALIIAVLCLLIPLQASALPSAGQARCPSSMHTMQHHGSHASGSMQEMPRCCHDQANCASSHISSNRVSNNHCNHCTGCLLQPGSALTGFQSAPGIEPAPAAQPLAMSSTDFMPFDPARIWRPPKAS